MSESELAELEKEIGFWSSEVNPRRKSIAQALVTEVRRLRGVLSDIQGSLQVINFKAAQIRRWIKDPNVDVAGGCKDIENCRLKIHESISAALFGKVSKDSSGGGR